MVETHRSLFHDDRSSCFSSAPRRDSHPQSRFPGRYTQTMQCRCWCRCLISQKSQNPKISNIRSQRSSKNLLPRCFIKTTTSPFSVRLLPSSLSNLASALPIVFVGRIGHGNATTTTAPKKVAVNNDERSDRCEGRYSDFRSGAIVWELGDIWCVGN
jgi:hypothetical protein